MLCNLVYYLSTMIRTQKHCSICNQLGHNRLTCPMKKISDMTQQMSDKQINKEINEEIIVDPKREQLIQDLIEKEEYSIPTTVFRDWLSYRRLCKLSEVRYLLDKQLNRDSLLLYFQTLESIDEYY